MPSDSPPPPRRRPPAGGADPSNRLARRGTSSSVARNSSKDKLVCAEGPEAGKEFPLADEELVIGRAPGNAVLLSDTSVSRRHASVRRTSGGWAVRDLGSGNGTQINGEPVESETPLRNGDRIVLGDTALTFVDGEHSTLRQSLPPPRRSTLGAEPAASRSRPVPRRTGQLRTRDPEVIRRRRTRLLAICGVAALLVVGAVVIKQKRDKQADQRRQAEIAAQESHTRTSALFQEGKNLVRDGKWVEAKAKFEQLAQINPEYPDLKAYLDRAAKEIPNQQHLTAALAALEANRLGTAAHELEAVTPDTNLLEAQRSARGQLESRLAARLLEARALLEAGGAKDLARMKSLVELTDDVLVVAPDNRDALELNKQAKSNVADLTRPVHVAAPSTPKPWLEVSSRFRDGDLSGALSLATECQSKPQCRAQAEQIRQFSEKYKKVETLPLEGLTELVELDGRITGGQSSRLVGPAVTRLASLHYRKASSAKAAGEWGKAVEYARKTLKADPGHAGAQSIVAELRSKAKELFMQAYTLKDSSPEDALQQFKEVVQMTPKDDENHIKAQNWVEKLQR